MSPCQRFCKILAEELFRVRTGLVLLVVLFELVFGFVWKIYEIRLASLVVLGCIGLSIIVRIGLALREKLITEHRINIKEPNTVYVYRSGSKLAVSEDDLTVGDLVFVDYNQSAPATGILVSKEEIEVDESKYGRGLQTKLPLEECLGLLGEKTELQLRMDVEAGALPSPMVLRGTANTTGRTFRMLVLAVDEHSVLQKHREDCRQEHLVSAIEAWIDSISHFVSKVSSVLLVIIVLFHLLALIFKIRGLPSG
jgi:magnesium-transporting ATPase (P-type)